MGANERTSGIGLRHVRVGLRDSDGTLKVPAGTAAGTAYSGRRAEGATALTITVPDPVTVPVSGDDRVYYKWVLPPTDNSAGELRVSKNDTQMIALVSGTKQWGSPNRRKVGFGSDSQGEEPELVIWGCRQVIEADEAEATYGTKKWETYYILNAIGWVKPSPFEYQSVQNDIYAITANDATVSEMGTAFTEAINGATKFEFLKIVTDKKYMLDAFAGDAAQTTFTLSQTPYESGIFNITLDGVVQNETTEWTRVTNVITMLVAPGAGTKLIVEYEYE